MFVAILRKFVLPIIRSIQQQKMCVLFLFCFAWPFLIHVFRSYNTNDSMWIKNPINKDEMLVLKSQSNQKNIENCGFA